MCDLRVIRVGFCCRWTLTTSPELANEHKLADVTVKGMCLSEDTSSVQREEVAVRLGKIIHDACAYLLSQRWFGI
jgi:hypothetical protein